MKRIVICCDGTWNRADQAAPTNVVKLAYRVAKPDQVLYYDKGVGTGNSLDRLLGGAFGHGLEDNVLDAYCFLVANYELGDEIYLFGFSRGAYTVRSLAGMIHKCGILRRGVAEGYPEMLGLYRDPHTKPNDPKVAALRERYSVGGNTRPPIAFLGVWDTVGALGIPLRGLRWLTRRRHQFHDTELSGSVRSAAQALAVDEHRGAFQPSVWDRKYKPGQTIRQQWFPGAHSDVGGGYEESGLSDVALEWMVDRAREAGLVIDEGRQPNAEKIIHNSRKGFWRLSPKVDRWIHGGILHASTIIRWATDSSYRPTAILRRWRAAE